MSLESAEWRLSGVPSPPRERRPTAGDRLARAVAFLILAAIFGASAFAIALVPYGIFIVSGLLVVGFVFLFFRFRDLERRMEEQKLLLESLRPPPPPGAP